MRSLLLLLIAFVVGAWTQCTCPKLTWATCEGTPCSCYVNGDGGRKINLNCTDFIPKCLLMEAEMNGAAKGKSRSGGKPVESAIIDNDGIYAPDCEADGKFKAKQCNKTETCWCVNSAGVRRTDKGDKSLKCDELVETYWVRFDLTHKPVNTSMDAASIKTGIENALLQRYQADKSLVKNVDYDPQARLVVVDVKKPIGDRKVDLTHIAYYLEKDIKKHSLLRSNGTFEASVAGQKVNFEKVIIYYVDEKGPTFTMKSLTGGVIAVIVVVILATIASVLVLYFIRKRDAQLAGKSQGREMGQVGK